MKKNLLLSFAAIFALSASAAESPVTIGETGYNTLNEAFAAAQTGDVITVNENTTITSRIGVPASLNVTLTCADGAAITGDLTTSFIEVSNAGAVLNLDNVLFKDCKAGHNQGIVCVKSSGTVNINNVNFENCTVTTAGRGEIFIGRNGSTIKGDNNLSIYLEKTCRIDNAGVDNTKPVRLYVEADRADGLIVKDCTDPAQFTLMDYPGKTLVVSGNDLNIGNDLGTAVEAIEAEAGEAEYFNLQGLRVAEENLTDGLYIVRKGNRTVKVMIRK